MSYTKPGIYRPVEVMITPLSEESIVNGIRAYSSATVASTTFPAANLAIYVPFIVPRGQNFTAYQLIIGNGGAVSGNLDLGIYSEAWALLTSAGSTAQSGTNTVQAVNITDYYLAPGRYYMAIAMDNTTGTTNAINTGTAPGAAMLGVAQEASAFPLPSTATPALFTQTNIPCFGLAGRASPV